MMQSVALLKVQHCYGELGHRGRRTGLKISGRLSQSTVCGSRNRETNNSIQGMTRPDSKYCPPSLTHAAELTHYIIKKLRIQSTLIKNICLNIQIHLTSFKYYAMYTKTYDIIPHQGIKFVKLKAFFFQQRTELRYFCLKVICFHDFCGSSRAI